MITEELFVKVALARMCLVLSIREPLVFSSGVVVKYRCIYSIKVLHT